MTNNKASFHQKALITATAAAMSLLVSTPLAAAESQESALVLEELIVSARRRAEAITDTPLSMAAITSDEIREANIASLTDIAANVVGFTTNAAFGRQADRPVIRGLSSIFTDEELAGYFIDGVFVSGSLQSFDLSALERVEVIKGPQSAMFGRRTFSGAVNYVTAHPQLGMSGSISAEVGQNGRQIVTGGVEGGSEVLSARLTLRSFEYDSQFKNELAGGPGVGGQESQSANLSTYWTPAETTSIHWNISYQKDDDEHFPLQLQGQSENNCFGGLYYCGTFKADNPIKIGGVLDNYGDERERLRTFVSIQQQLGDIDMTFNTAYSKLEEQGGADQSFSGFPGYPIPGLTGLDWHTMSDLETTDISYELRFAGSLVDDRLEWQLGAYHGTLETEKFTTGRNVTSIQEAENQALMAGVEYEILPWLKAGLEARYAEDTVSLDSQSPLSAFEDETTYYEATYRFTLAADVGADGMAYLNIATGTLPGGFNANPDLPADLIPIDQQEVTQYELGYKTVLTQTLRLSAAAYLIEWTNQAASEFTYNDRLGNYIPAGIGYRDTKGETEVKGIELEMVALLSTSWDFSAGVTWQDAKAKQMIATDGKDIAINGSNDLSGKRLPLTSEWEAVAALTYRTSLNDTWALRARIDGNYQSERYTRFVSEASNGDQLVANGLVALDSDQWNLSLWVRNLTDEDSTVSALRYIDANAAFGTAFALTPRRERELGVTARYSF